MLTFLRYPRPVFLCPYFVTTLLILGLTPRKFCILLLRLRLIHEYSDCPLIFSRVVMVLPYLIGACGLLPSCGVDPSMLCTPWKSRGGGWRGHFLAKAGGSWLGHLFASLRHPGNSRFYCSACLWYPGNSRFVALFTTDTPVIPGCFTLHYIPFIPGYKLPGKITPGSHGIVLPSVPVEVFIYHDHRIVINSCLNHVVFSLSYI